MLFEWIKKNWIPILVGIMGLTAGFLLNVYANKRSEAKIIDALTAEIESLKNKQAAGRVTPDEQKRLIELQAQLQILKS